MWSRRVKSWQITPAPWAFARFNGTVCLVSSLVILQHVTSRTGTGVGFGQGLREEAA